MWNLFRRQRMWYLSKRKVLNDKDACEECKKGTYYNDSNLGYRKELSNIVKKVEYVILVVMILWWKKAVHAN